MPPRPCRDRRFELDAVALVLDLCRLSGRCTDIETEPLGFGVAAIGSCLIVLLGCLARPKELAREVSDDVEEGRITYLFDLDGSYSGMRRRYAELLR